MSANQTTPVLGEFELPGGHRKIIQKTVKGEDQLLDVPKKGRGPKYLIEPNIRDLPTSETRDIVLAYMQHAQSLGRSPIPKPLQTQKALEGAKPGATTQTLSRDLISG